MKQSTHHKSPPGYLQRIFLLGILAGIFFLVAFWGSSCTQVTTPLVNGGIDTTSHDFTFFVDTLGHSGLLSDVAIINDTLVYAVGEIFLRDSTGQIDPTAYSVAIWNGVKWQLKRLYYNENSLITSIRGVSALGANDVWLAAGSIFHWDGVSSIAQLSFSRLNLPDANATLEKLWVGVGPKLYAVGNAGTIVFHDRISWQWMQVGSAISLTDVWGVEASSLQPFVIAVGSDFGTNHHVYAISESSVQDTMSRTWTIRPFGVWFTNPVNVYVAADGVWRYSDGSWEEGLVLSVPFNRVKGSAENNIFATGKSASKTYVVLYNGASWKELNAPTNAILRGLAVHPKLVVAVGDYADVPIIIRGYPQ